VRKADRGRRAKSQTYNNCRGKIPTEAFAVIVYIVEMNSFRPQHDSDRQLTTGNEAIAEMFRYLTNPGSIYLTTDPFCI
jgi:hypothetical protein